VEHVPQLLDNAREAIDRLSRVTGNLMAASRSGALQLGPTSPQDHVKLIGQACRWARAAAVAKGLSLEWAREPLSVLVLGDADALLSVLGNLLSNAVRYTPAGGQVVVRHGLMVDEVGQWGWVEVADTGVGMSPEVQKRIFERFYRAPEAGQHDSQGVGLGVGLSLVEQFVAAHGGRVEVDSAVGQGSTFRVYLPAAPPADDSPPLDDDPGSVTATDNADGAQTGISTRDASAAD
jgi:two-component system OmpR family sensor kinase